MTHVISNGNTEFDLGRGIIKTSRSREYTILLVGKKHLLLNKPSSTPRLCRRRNWDGENNLPVIPRKRLERQRSQPLHVLPRPYQ